MFDLRKDLTWEFFLLFWLLSIEIYQTFIESTDKEFNKYKIQAITFPWNIKLTSLNQIY